MRGGCVEIAPADVGDVFSNAGGAELKSDRAPCAAQMLPHRDWLNRTSLIPFKLTGLELKPV